MDSISLSTLRNAVNMDDEVDLHRFWDTQPVPKMGEAPLHAAGDAGPMEADKTPDEVRREPYKLPGGFSWATLRSVARPRARRARC